MRAIEVSGYGTADVLRLAELADPAHVPGKVRVAVAASTASPVDTLIRSGAFTAFTPGLEPPFVLGWDFAGTLVDPGAGLPAGARVCGNRQWIAEVTSTGSGAGTNAETVVVDPGCVVAIPDGVPDHVAAAVPLNGLAAAQAVALAGAGAGSVVLVTGASGSVGGFAVQLAAAAGATVLAIGAAPEDEEYVRGLGAAGYLSRTEAAGDAVTAIRTSAPHGVDAVVDAATLGGAILGAVRDGGVFVALTVPSRPEPERGIRTDLAYAPTDPGLLADLVQAVGQGRLRPRIADVLPLVDAAEAHRRLEAGGVRGKLVLAVR